MANGTDTGTPMKQAGDVSIASVPNTGIMKHLMALKLAQQSGDSLAVKTAQGNYEAEVQKMRAKLFDSDAKKWHQMYKKATADVDTANQNIAMLTSGRDQDVEKIKQAGTANVEHIKGQNERALDAQNYEQDIDMFRYEMASLVEGLRGLDLDYTDDEINDIVKMAVAKKYGGVTKPDDVIMWETLNEMKQNNKISDEKMRWAWQTYKGGKAGSGSGSNGAGGEERKQGAYNMRTDIKSTFLDAFRDMPLKMREKDGGFLWKDKTEGRFSTDWELERIADGLVDNVMALGQRGIPPWQVQAQLNEQKALWYRRASETGGHTRGGVRRDIVHEFTTGEDGMNFRDIEDIKMGQRFVNFFESPAGREFEEWLRTSVSAGYFIDPLGALGGSEPPQGQTRTDPQRSATGEPDDGEPLTPDDAAWTATPGEEPPADHERTLPADRTLRPAPAPQPSAHISPDHDDYEKSQLRKRLADVARGQTGETEARTKAKIEKSVSDRGWKIPSRSSLGLHPRGPEMRGENRERGTTLTYTGKDREGPGFLDNMMNKRDHPLAGLKSGQKVEIRMIVLAGESSGSTTTGLEVFSREGKAPYWWIIPLTMLHEFTD